MSVSSVSSESTNQTGSTTNTSITIPDDNEGLVCNSVSSELVLRPSASDAVDDHEPEELIANSSSAEAVHRDEIWFQAFWTLKLGPEDLKYLESEVATLLAKDAWWPRDVFPIPKVTLKSGSSMISLAECRTLLLNNPRELYKIVAITEVLLNANDKTLECVFEKCADQLEWVRDWLELFNLIFRRVVDSKDTKRRVETHEETRQIFRRIRERKKLFKVPKRLQHLNIQEYNDSKHNVECYEDTHRINEWRYPGWLPKIKEEKGKPPPPTLFHRILEDVRKDLNGNRDLRKLEAKLLKELGLETPMKNLETAQKELEAAEKELEDSRQAHEVATDDRAAKMRYEKATRECEAAKEYLVDAQREYKAAALVAETDQVRRERRAELEKDRERRKEKQKEHFLSKPSYWWVKEKRIRDKLQKEKDERQKEKDERNRKRMEKEEEEKKKKSKERERKEKEGKEMERKKK